MERTEAFYEMEHWIFLWATALAIFIIWYICLWIYSKKYSVKLDVTTKLSTLFLWNLLAYGAFKFVEFFIKLEFIPQVAYILILSFTMKYLLQAVWKVEPKIASKIAWATTIFAILAAVLVSVWEGYILSII